MYLSISNGFLKEGVDDKPIFYDGNLVVNVEIYHVNNQNRKSRSIVIKNGQISIDDTPIFESNKTVFGVELIGFTYPDADKSINSAKLFREWIDSVKIDCTNEKFDDTPNGIVKILTDLDLIEFCESKLESFELQFVHRVMSNETFRSTDLYKRIIETRTRDSTVSKVLNKLSCYRDFDTLFNYYLPTFCALVWKNPVYTDYIRKIVGKILNEFRYWICDPEFSIDDGTENNGRCDARAVAYVNLCRHIYENMASNITLNYASYKMDYELLMKNVPKFNNDQDVEIYVFTIGTSELIHSEFVMAFYKIFYDDFVSKKSIK